MSATLDPDWLRTVDFDPAGLKVLSVALENGDREQMRMILEARKRLGVAGARMGEADPLAKAITTAHKEADGRTLVVVNTVARARELHSAVQRQLAAEGVPVDPILIHSRFRPPDRSRQVERLLEKPGERGMIAISTQVVEAGVDVSARTLFTELAPWSSLVQRFGRCNRRGLDDEKAQVFLIDLPDDEKGREKVRHPYELSDLARSQGLLRNYNDVSPNSLEAIPFDEPFQHKWVIRRKDFSELFDTTPDLAGNDIDIDRYVRDIEESDVQLFWREWPVEQPPPADERRPRRDELCSVPIGDFRRLVKDSERRGLTYRWDYLDRKWVGVTQDRICPGQIYVLHAQAGSYSQNEGWNIDVGERVAPIPIEDSERDPESNDDDRLSEGSWQSISEHTDRVFGELETILKTLSLPESRVLELAARWHDRGKAHRVFQGAVRSATQGQPRPAAWLNRADIGKAPDGWWDKYERKHFRHELASALAALMGLNGDVAQESLDLVAYLVAAHHGKVRLSIRSLPGEKTPSGERRFARGVWDGDGLPAVDLGGGVIAPDVTLSLEPMELGLCEEAPFKGQPSWAERVLALRDKLGSIHLAHLEAILRAADMRASKDREGKEKFSA
jgi:CRISPR-associated endonuclease/helicase Cas3